MAPHAHTIESKAGASIRSLPPMGAHASLEAPQEYFFEMAAPSLQGAALQEA